MIKNQKPRRELKRHSMRAVGVYLLLLLVAAILLLLVAHATQEHAFALSVANLIY